MNHDKITRKSAEALSLARDTASLASNSSVEPIHILSALLSDREGIFTETVLKCEVDADELSRLVSEGIRSLPKISFGGRREASQGGREGKRGSC